MLQCTWRTWYTLRRTLFSFLHAKLLILLHTDRFLDPQKMVGHLFDICMFINSMTSADTFRSTCSYVEFTTLVIDKETFGSDRRTNLFLKPQPPKQAQSGKASRRTVNLDMKKKYAFRQDWLCCIERASPRNAWAALYFRNERLDHPGLC